jgi:hypothetical protein
MRPGDSWGPAHDRAADALIQRLRAGLRVAYPGLGDPSLYASSLYLYRRIAPCCPCEIIPGVPAMCAAAAALGAPLAQGRERLTILPGFGALDHLPEGAVVVLKAGARWTRSARPPGTAARCWLRTWHAGRIPRAARGRGRAGILFFHGADQARKGRTMKKILPLMLCFALCLALAAPNALAEQAKAISFCRRRRPRDPAGRAGKRIISLYSAHTENLYFLGAGEKLIGAHSTSTFPPEAAALPRYDYQGDPESVIAADPDLVADSTVHHQKGAGLCRGAGKAASVVSLYPEKLDQFETTLKSWRCSLEPPKSARAAPGLPCAAKRHSDPDRRVFAQGEGIF